MTESYTHKDIKVLSEMEHIQKNPSMYIGDLKDPNHLIFEVLDNALDEANAGHAKLVGVVIDNKNHTCTISDNGRGIPFENNTIATIATKLFSGGKFEKGENNTAYKIATGLHGIGLVAVTALSDWLTISVYRTGKRAVCEFENAKLKNTKIEDFDGDKPFSTQISFKPNKKYFESLTFDVTQIRERLKLASVHIEHLQLIFVVDGQREIINCGIEEYFVETLLDGKKTPSVTQIFDIRKKIKDEELHIKFCWDLKGSYTPKITGCVNLLDVSQGSHINMTYDVFRKVFEDLSKKEKLKFLAQDSLVGFRAHVSLFLYNPEYTSQTKEKLATSRVKLEHIFSDAQEQLVKILTDNPELCNQLLAYFDSYRRRLDTNKNIIKSSTVTRYNNVIDSKLMDCTSSAVEKTELFITEGSSASGSLVQCRNPKYHGILGLKGKILNVASEAKDAFKNKEIIEIINALGTGAEPDFSIENLRYGKIIFACDADSDGSHINTLLMVLFLKFVPELLKKNHVFRAIMPLYGFQLKDRFQPIYSEEELAKAKQIYQNIKPQRYKGLGEMNSDQLRVCLLDNVRRLQPVTYPDNTEEIFKLMVDANMKRELIEKMKVL